MSALPYPPGMRAALTFGPRANRSLLFDRCFASYDQEWQIMKEDHRHHIPDGKLQFFTTFVTAFAKHNTDDFAAFLERRRSTLAALGAALARMRSTSRLVVGLGLPHPTETSLLLDRLSGCPYLPGSSVKGMLREAAKLVARGELPAIDEVRNHWTDAAVRRIFGPSVGEAGYPAQGEMVFYDAFPVGWPTLELDVLTPHYGEYYGDRTGSVAPGDWENPNPVRFLTVKAGVVFDFYFRGLCPDAAQRAEDKETIKALLPLALDWLGIGAKKSAGYGLFGPAGTPHGDPTEAKIAPPVPMMRPAPQRRVEGPAKPHDSPRYPEHERQRDSREGPAAFPPRPREAVRETVTKEIVTLESLPEGTRAWVTTADGIKVRCKGVVTYPRQPSVGDRLKANVTRRAGMPIDAEFKGWV